MYCSRNIWKKGKYELTDCDGMRFRSKKGQMEGEGREEVRWDSRKDEKQK